MVWGSCVFRKCLSDRIEWSLGTKWVTFLCPRKVKEYFQVFFSFVFLHNGIKAFFYNPWIEFRASQEHVWLFHVFEHRSKKERRRERGMLPPASHSKPQSWMLRIQQADVRDSRSWGYAISCWDRSRWKGRWLSGTAKVLDLFLRKALLRGVLLGSWLCASSALADTCWMTC